MKVATDTLSDPQIPLVPTEQEATLAMRYLQVQVSCFLPVSWQTGIAHINWCPILFHVVYLCSIHILGLILSLMNSW